MKYLIALSAFVLISSCAPVREPATGPQPAAAGNVKPAVPVAIPPAPAHPLESTRAITREISGLVFEGVAFDSRSHRLAVADQAGGPGSEVPDAAGAARARGGLAAVNAGFFTPSGEPLGLVITSGKGAGAWNSSSSLGGGVWHENPAGQSAISRRENLGRTGAATMRELIQAGPMLVENHRAVSGLDPIKSSVRTILLWDGGYRWWLGRTSACTLAELATALACGHPADWPVRHALNLDGGRSSDLWISAAITGGPLTRRAPWNRPVRNFLILTPR